MKLALNPRKSLTLIKKKSGFINIIFHLELTQKCAILYHLLHIYTVEIIAYFKLTRELYRATYWSLEKVHYSTHWVPKPEPARWPTSPTRFDPSWKPLEPTTLAAPNCLYKEAKVFIRAEVCVYICRHGEAGLTHSSFPTSGGLQEAGTKLTLSYDSVLTAS